MQLLFASRLAAVHRDRITQMLSRMTYPLGLGDWTFRVHVKRYAAHAEAEAEIVVEPASHEARLYLDRKLFANDLALHRALVHELTHVLTWGAYEALADLVAHVPGDQRRACRVTAIRAYEAANDAVALVLTKLLAT